MNDKLVMGAAALAAAALMACAVRLTVTVENSPLGDYDVELEIDSRDNSVSVKPTDAVPAGACVKLTWLDGSGNPLGCDEAEAGGEAVAPPPGTEDMSISPCEAEEEPKDTIRQPEPLVRAAQGPKVFAYRQMPFDLSDGQGRWAEFTVRAPNRTKADEAARRFRAGMLQGPCPKEVTPFVIADVELLGDGRVRYSVFTLQAPTSLDFGWNGAPLFTLAEATVVFANGWYSTTVIVPASLVESPFPGFPSVNVASCNLEKAGRALVFETAVVSEL